MANSDKDILITSNKGSSTDDPKIEFKGASSSLSAQTITVKAYPLSNGTVSFEGSAGQLFSVTNNLTSGSIYSVNDVSGIPSIDVNADGTVLIAPYNGNIGFGTVAPTSKFHFVGNVTLSGNLTASGQNAIVNQHDVSSVGTWTARILSKNSNADRASFLGIYAGNAGVFAQNNALNAWADLYVNTADGTSGGAVRMPGVTVSSGSISATSDSSFNSVLVGRGSGNVSTNTAIGYRALFSNTTGLYNTAIGYQALYSNIYQTTGYGNVAVGYQALFANSDGHGNVAVGHQALYSNTTGEVNTAIGTYALNYNITGFSNVAIGGYALAFNTYGHSNVAIGEAALYVNNGNSNTAIGIDAGRYNTSGRNNVFLGFEARNTAGGADAWNTIVLGNSSITTLRCNTSTISSLSDQRDKKDIENIPLGLYFLNDLRPVKFIWNQRDHGRVNLPDSGFIAQEALKVIEKYDAEWFGLVDNQNPEHFEMASSKLIPVIVKAIQELFALINKQEE